MPFGKPYKIGDVFNSVNDVSHIALVTENRAVDYTPEQQFSYEKMIADRYEVDPKYFSDKYNMPVGERRQQQVPSPDPDDDGDDDKDPKKQHNARPFFD